MMTERSTTGGGVGGRAGCRESHEAKRAVDKDSEEATAMRGEKLPNIVFIMADDMGYGDVSCYNPESAIPTPNMDRLAREGMRFTDAHSPSAVCTPTRYGVLTGRYCWRPRLKESVLFGYEPPLIEPDRLTAASLLRQAGYSTACIGKWHLGLGWTVKPGAQVDLARPLPWPSITDRSLEEQIDFTQPITGGPTALGFDYFFGTSGCCTCQPPYGFIENERFPEAPSVYDDKPLFTGRPGMKAPSWNHKEADPTICRAAVSYIEGQAESDRPFFLYLCPSAPHEPCTESVVPEPARGRSAAGPRGDLVWLFDWVVGEVIEALDRAGQSDNTLLLVTSDNGALPGDRVRGEDGRQCYRDYGHKSCGNWRGYKSHIWEGGHREPLIARWPGRIERGRVSDQLVCLTDLMATCAAISGSRLPTGAGEDSYDLLPALLETTDRSLRNGLVHTSGFGVFSIRQGEWKLVLDTEGSGGWPPPTDTGITPGGRGQLYNIVEDPFEQRNLWDDCPQVVQRLRELLRRHQEEGRGASG